MTETTHTLTFDKHAVFAKMKTHTEVSLRANEAVQSGDAEAERKHAHEAAVLAFEITDLLMPEGFVDEFNEWLMDQLVSEMFAGEDK